MAVVIAALSRWIQWPSRWQRSLVYSLCYRSWLFEAYTNCSPSVYLVRNCNSQTKNRIKFNLRIVVGWLYPRPIAFACRSARVGTKISMIYIVIVSWYFQAKISRYFWYFRYFQNINLFYYSLLTFLIHAYLTKTAQVPKLLDAAKYWRKF